MRLHSVTALLHVQPPIAEFFTSTCIQLKGVFHQVVAHHLKDTKHMLKEYNATVFKLMA